MRFIDTSFWYALQERRDRRHPEARDLVRHGVGRTITSNHVLGETWMLLRRRAAHDAAVGFIDRVRRLPQLEVVHIDERLESDAWRWLRQRPDREFSFVDATSFALMRARRVREALAFDGDFNAAGFVEVRPG
jgi:predicted nucleic acid-binding protein